MKDGGRSPVCACEYPTFFFSVSLPHSPSTLGVKQTCSDNEGRLLFRLGRRQSSPHFASAATGESLQLTIITLSTDNTATHHSQSITPVTHKTCIWYGVRNNVCSCMHVLLHAKSMYSHCCLCEFMWQQCVFVHSVFCRSTQISGPRNHLSLPHFHHLW